jgi:hypothetical protein
LIPMFRTPTYNFYDVGKVTHSRRKMAVKDYHNMQDTLYQSVLSLDQEQLIHKRTTYNLLDLMSDLGGVMELFLLIVGYFIAPVSEHSFIMKAIRMVYMAKTKDTKIFCDKEHYIKFQDHQRFVGNDPA